MSVKPGTLPSQASTRNWRCIGRLKRCLHIEELLVMLTPGNAFARAERPFERWQQPPQRRHALKGGNHQCRAVLVGEDHRRLWRQPEAPGSGIVRNEAIRGLRGEPFLEIALRDSGSSGQVRGRGRSSIRQRLPQPEPVAEADERGVDRGGCLPASVVHERLERVWVEPRLSRRARGGVFDRRRHRFLPGIGFTFKARDPR